MEASIKYPIRAVDGHSTAIPDRDIVINASHDKLSDNFIVVNVSKPRLILKDEIPILIKVINKFIS